MPVARFAAVAVVVAASIHFAAEPVTDYGGATIHTAAGKTYRRGGGQCCRSLRERTPFRARQIRISDVRNAIIESVLRLGFRASNSLRISRFGFRISAAGRGRGAKDDVSPNPFVLTVTGCGLAAKPSRKPNVVFILADNLGYGDLGFLGSKVHRTPHVDRMAAQGITLRHFYSASGVCTPSRAALLTGCYPQRVGLANPQPDGLVLRPVSPNGLHPDEITIAEVLKQAGYTTACIGKWHLGDQPPFLPTRQGFDSYFGIPYSEDMVANKARGWPPLPLMENERVVEAPADRATLTQRYTRRAVRFIERNRDRPFFLYLPHAVPGSVRRPFASKTFRGKSANGPYGDSVEELDWSTGVLLKRIRELGLAKRTLVVFTSDNGTPRRRTGGGSNLPLGGFGYTTAEGGMRVPCIAWWPGRIPAGTKCDELTTMMDWLPTLATLAASKLEPSRRIDGRNILPLLEAKPGARTPHKAYFYYQQDQLQAVRSGRWKLYLPLRGVLRRMDAHTKARIGSLFDVQADPGEKHNLAAKHAAIVKRLLKLAESARRDLGDLNRPGKGQRPAGRVKAPVPVELKKSAQEFHRDGQRGVAEFVRIPEATSLAREFSRILRHLRRFRHRVSFRGCGGGVASLVASQ